MSSGAVANTLLSLLPTYTLSTIPKPLQDTALALLAQSRSRVPTLKPEEEPARAWACAEIAVKRLQTRLNLPTIAHNPPCPPRTYKKLYQYLDRSLESPSVANASSSVSLTPQKSKASIAIRSAANTPFTPQTNGTKLGDKSRTPTNKRRFENGEVAGNHAPEWVAPTIRHLCRKFSAPAAIPHVYVGVLSTLRTRVTRPDLTARSTKRARTSSARDSSASTSVPHVEPLQENEVCAMIVAILFLVLDKIQLDASHKDILTKPDEVAFEGRAAAQELVALGRVSVSNAGAVIVGSKRLLDQHSREWMATEWWDSVPQGELDDSQAEGDAIYRENQHDSMERADGSSKISTTARPTGEATATDLMASGRGLGAIDWLGEERRQDYRIWQAEMLKRIERIEELPTPGEFTVL